MYLKKYLKYVSETLTYNRGLFRYFSHFQRILRTYDGRETCVWSAAQRKHYVRSIYKHTSTIPPDMYMQMYSAVTLQPTAADGGDSLNARENAKEKRRLVPVTQV